MGTVAGFVLCSEQATDDAGDGRTAWLDLIAVRRAWRRQGVASALMSASLVALAEEGFRTVALQVDADSPTGALDLYERHGFRVKRTETVFALEMSDAALTRAVSSRPRPRRWSTRVPELRAALVPSTVMVTVCGPALEPSQLATSRRGLTVGL